MRFPSLLFFSFLYIPLLAQNDEADTLYDVYDAVSLNTDSLEATFVYQRGNVVIADGAATLSLPDSFKFLAGEQARQLVVDLWENPPSISDEIIGVVMYADAGAFDERSAFIVYYSPIGFVTDADADGIDYSAMLKDMLKEDSLENASRVEAGYDPLWLLGWASPPFYDKQAKVLHWAKEMRSTDSTDHVLNYNVRVLGRRGVLLINGISSMSRLPTVQQEIAVLTGAIAFNDGYRYDQFNAATDEVADWSVGGLIDGKVKEKMAGVLMLVLKTAAIGLVCLIVIVVLILWLVRRSRRSPLS